MSIFLGIAAALFIGLSDTAGRASSRRDESSITHVTTQMAVGTVVALPFAFLIDSSLIGRDIVSGALSGIFVAIGLAMVYRAMADASSAVTAPLAGVIAVLIPLVWDLLTGGSLTGLEAVGCAVAIVSLVVVSFNPDMGTEQLRRGLGLAAVGGVFFGLTFVFAGGTSEASGAWPAVFNRGFGLVGITILASTQKVPLFLKPSVRKFGVLGGFAGAFGMLAMIVGAQIGSLGTVSVLAGLSPAVIVVLTAVFDEDEVRWWQGIGVVGTIVGATLIAVGA